MMFIAVLRWMLGKECVRLHQCDMRKARAGRGRCASRRTWRSAMQSLPQAESPPKMMLAGETAVWSVPRGGRIR